MRGATAMHQLDWGPRGPAGVAAPAGGVLVVTDGAGVVATYQAGDGGVAPGVVLQDGAVASIVRPGRVLARAGWSRRVLRGTGGDLAGLEVGPGGEGSAWTRDGRRFALQRVGGTWEVRAPETGVLVRVGASSIAVAEEERAGWVGLALLVLDLVCVPPDATRSWCAEGGSRHEDRWAALRA